MSLQNPASLSAARNLAVPTNIDLVWPYAANNGYHIYRQTDGAGAWTLVKTVDPEVGFGQGGFGLGPFGQAYSVVTAWTDPTASIASSYQYRIHSIDQSSGVPTDLEPGVLSGVVNAFVLAFVNAGRRRFDAGVDLKWDAIAGATGFKVYRSVSGGPYTYLDTAAAGATGYNDAAAAHLVVNQYQVTIMSGAVESPACTSNSVGAEAPRAVTNVVAVKNGKAIDLSWANVEQGDGVRVYRAAGGGDFVLVQSLPADAQAWQDPAGGLSLGRRYRYAVAQFTATGGECRVQGNEESVNDTLSLLWVRGAGSTGDETFEVARKRLPVNPRQIPVLKGDAARCPALRTREPWTVVATLLPATHYEDTNFTRTKYYAVGVRARDASGNLSRRSVAGVQG